MKNQNSQAALHAAGWPDFYMKLRKRERGGGRVRVEKLATLLGPHQMLAAGLSQERTGCLKKIMSILNEPKANKEKCNLLRENQLVQKQEKLYPKNYKY